ncbi:cysteine-rich receptor-like protein kinase 10 isoform X2 [Tasmannia lanceolata]|uniref:cysteine-rich receptor-like protein kinase 10 isoform X2 n=1 Tax=Tasmannia lanceolata TaxID=3420 RepID=UPI004063F5CA
MFQLITLSFILVMLRTHATAYPLYKFCLETGDYTSDSTYQINLGHLLQNLSSEAVRTRFYNTTIGQSPDTVYALVLCRVDIVPSVCQSCIDTAGKEIIQVCPNSRSAIVYYDYCLLRYSNQRIVFSVDNSPKVYMWNGQNISTTLSFPRRGKRDRFTQLIETTMTDLASRAAYSSSNLMFATGEINITESPKMYFLVQCAQDLTPYDCNACLNLIISQIPLCCEAKHPICCEAKQGGRVIGPSCNFRFETSRFYADSPASSPFLPPLPPLPLTPSSSTTEPGQGRQPSRLIIFITLGGFLGLGLLGFCVYYYLRRSRGKRKGNKENIHVLLHHLGTPAGIDSSQVNMQGENDLTTQELPLIDFGTVKDATDNFSTANKLGEGGFGPVYKGILPDGKEIAVKRLSRNSGQGLEEFKNEVMLIAKLQHRNLVRLLCWCIQEEEKLLIYEYMPNTSLDVFLFDPNKHGELNWKRRVDIIRGIARGLLYLHEDSRLKIIHRDLKASNVLLDKDMNPKISDFGMARIFSGNQNEANTNRVVGTYGYMAPEYAMEGIFSVKSDVFSFGVLLLEIVSGKRNSGFYLSEHAQSLLTYAWRLWVESKGQELIDPSFIDDTCPVSEALRCIHIGLLCVQEDAADRPTMSSVVLMLGGESLGLRQPKQPAFSVGRGGIVRHQPSESSTICSANEITGSSVKAR